MLKKVLKEKLKNNLNDLIIKNTIDFIKKQQALLKTAEDNESKKVYQENIKNYTYYLLGLLGEAINNLGLDWKTLNYPKTKEDINEQLKVYYNHIYITCEGRRVYLRVYPNAQYHTDFYSCDYTLPEAERNIAYCDFNNNCNMIYYM